MGNTLRYYVEGQCEKHLIDSFKSGENSRFKTGKVEVFNINNEILSKARMISFTKGTTLVLIYDTDVKPTQVFLNNINMLKSNKNISHIYHVQSVENFEDELVYSTCLKNINKMFDTQSSSEFKTKFVNSNIVSKLNSLNFNHQKMWIHIPKNDFKNYPQNSKSIKL